MRTKRYNLNTRKKYFIKKIHNFKCSNCKKTKSAEELEIDHITPLSNGGNNDYSNLQPLCIDCHLSKTRGEWKDNAFIQEKITNLNPEDKLEIINDWLNEHKEYNYCEIQFMILNHPLLSTFEYNSTILSLLFNKITGKNEEKKHKWKKQRNLSIKTLYNSLGTYQKVADELKKNGLSMGITTIADICSKEW